MWIILSFLTTSWTCLCTENFILIDGSQSNASPFPMTIPLSFRCMNMSEEEHSSTMYFWIHFLLQAALSEQILFPYLTQWVWLTYSLWKKQYLFCKVSWDLYHEWFSTSEELFVEEMKSTNSLEEMKGSIPLYSMFERFTVSKHEQRIPR